MHKLSNNIFVTFVFGMILNDISNIYMQYYTLNKHILVFTRLK